MGDLKRGLLTIFKKDLNTTTAVRLYLPLRVWLLAEDKRTFPADKKSNQAANGSDEVTDQLRGSSWRRQHSEKVVDRGLWTFLTVNDGHQLSSQYVPGCSVSLTAESLIRDGTRHNLPLDIQHCTGRYCDNAMNTSDPVVVMVWGSVWQADAWSLFSTAFWNRSYTFVVCFTMNEWMDGWKNFACALQTRDVTE